MVPAFLSMIPRGTGCANGWAFRKKSSTTRAKSQFCRSDYVIPVERETVAMRRTDRNARRFGASGCWAQGKRYKSKRQTVGWGKRGVGRLKNGGRRDLKKIKIK